MVRFGFPGAIGFAFDLDDGCAFNETVEESHSQWRIADVISPAVEIDVGEQGCGATVVASDDDLIKQVSGLRGFEAFDAIEGELVDDPEFGPLIAAEP